MQSKQFDLHTFILVYRLEM